MTHILVVGGGLVGLATGSALQRSGHQVTVLEAGTTLAPHQSSHNSGVVHAGLYYPPGTLKARLCVAGRDALYRFCAEHGVAHRRTGKLVVAASRAELPRMAALEERARANGLEGVERLSPEGLREYEPHARGVAALRVPQTGIVDFPGVASALGRQIEQAGGSLRLHARVRRIVARPDAITVETPSGEVSGSFLVNCAGLEADRIARMGGVVPRIRIVPFRGEYHVLRADRRDLVRSLIYPVPDPAMPFLGVHFTRRIDGAVDAGPNAVLALARYGYRWRSVSPQDLVDMLVWPGTWRMMGRLWATGAYEIAGSLSTRVLARRLRKLVPDVEARDLLPGGSGVRAQAVDRAGRLVGDFVIDAGDRSLHVLNAPSPAATACLAIGEAIAQRVPSP